MAQEHDSRMRRAGLLASRYGLRGKAAVVGLCAAVMVVVGAVGLMRALSPSGVVVARGEASARPQADGAQATTPGGASAEAEDATAVEASVAVGAEGEDQPTTCVFVHVDGAVACPGVYEVEGAPPRVNDAVVLAGGLAEGADTSTINLAAPITDGQKVHVPTAEEVAQLGAEQTGWDAGQVGDASAADPVAGTTSAGGLININAASEEELRQLPGVGEATARAIVEDRARNGSFAVPEDLMRVSGIGQKKFDKMRDLVCV